MATIKVNLGDGRFLLSDVPTPEVIEAMQRVRQAGEDKTEPREKDVKTMTDWLSAQHEKYGGITVEEEREER